ncbi:mtcA2 [Symbiodinium sp. CCMP2456]|nr:mtcA2 [Symbiodinium sp. CCMP2456]
MSRKLRASSWFKGGTFGLPLVDVYGDMHQRPTVDVVLAAKKALPSDAEVDKIKKQFKELDVNKDGTLSFEEMKKMMVTLSPKLSEVQLQKLFCAADVDQSGTVELDEFIDFVLKGKQVVAKIIQEPPQGTPSAEGVRSDWKKECAAPAPPFSEHCRQLSSLAAFALIPVTPLSIMASGGYPGVRTTKTGDVAPSDALKLLKEGNARFVEGKPQSIKTNAEMRTLLVEEGQAPHTAIIGCADSRAPLEKIFDAMPGDIFVLRNAGNTCTHAEGSFVGSLEFATGALGSRLILVLGHTKCGAIYGATKGYFDAKLGAGSSSGSALEALLHDLGSVAEVAAGEKGASADFETVASHAVKVNVFHTINFLLKYSKSLRQQVQSGKLEIQGGIYQLETGKVEFLGPSPEQKALTEESIASLPPSLLAPKEPAPATVRTAADDAVIPQKALEYLKSGNKRYVAGTPKAPTTTQDMRKALVDKGQAPHAAIIGCADSRAPVETLFDAAPGDLFVLRNAGNTCTHAEGSFLGSLEFCVGKLGSRLIVVMGHTNCGALAGAAGTYLSIKEAAETKTPGCALEGLLQGLTSVAGQTAQEMGGTPSAAEIASAAVKVNVFNTINFLLKFSEPIRALAKSGDLEIHGAVYKLETGEVDFFGPSPKQAELLASKMQLPPSMSNAADSLALIGAHGVRTPEDPPMAAQAALKLLKEGNERFAVGAPIAGRIDAKMRKALATVGQAPHTAVLGCADSRVPLELVFDGLPGDLFVLRNAGNTCVHSEGSVMGSLEFCTGALGTKLILVLGHTKCGAINGATKDYMANKGKSRDQASNALGALLQGLNDVAKKAEEELGGSPKEEEIAVHAVKVNVFNSMDFLVKNSPVLKSKVESGEVEIEGGIYDLDSGRVRWLGKSPNAVKGCLEGPSGRHGQNIFWIWPCPPPRLYDIQTGSLSNPTHSAAQEKMNDQMTQAWYDEINQPGYDWKKATFSPGTGHFTQVVWKGTKQVGMALSEDGRFCVANYFPAGNMMGSFKENVLPRGTPYEPKKEAPKPAPKARAAAADAGAPSSDAGGEPKKTVTAKTMTPELAAVFEDCPFPFKEKAETALNEGAEVTVTREEIGIRKTIEVTIKQGHSTSRMRGAWGARG